MVYQGQRGRPPRIEDRNPAYGKWKYPAIRVVAWYTKPPRFVAAQSTEE